MPTLVGLRRRGYTPESIRGLCDRVGVTKYNSTTDMALLEHCLRADLNERAPRVMGVLRPLRVVIENYPQDQVEPLRAVNNPQDPRAGTRMIPFSREIYIERDDFREDPPNKFFRLAPGREVRLRYAYLITCTNVVKDDSGEITELRCTYDPATRGGDAPDGRKVKSTLHWVSARQSLPAQVRLYDRLFSAASPGQATGNYLDDLNPDSLETLTGCRVESGLGDELPGYICQFERQGYFCIDPDSTRDSLVFNRTVALRDAWARIEKATGKEPSR
jgi:glutaminyl-tRNA synthetase